MVLGFQNRVIIPPPFGGTPSKQLTELCSNTSRDGGLFITPGKHPFPLLNTSQYLRALPHNELKSKFVISRNQVCSFCLQKANQISTHMTVFHPIGQLS